jgi:hypothetical protein
MLENEAEKCGRQWVSVNKRLWNERKECQKQADLDIYHRARALQLFCGSFVLNLSTTTLQAINRTQLQSIDIDVEAIHTIETEQDK